VLSGTEDLRTPIAGAREVAAQIPDAHLLAVPDTGHSVLSNEPTSCAREALRALFSPAAPKRCRSLPLPPILRPPPLPPTRLAAVSAARGYRGTPGRTLHAVSLTFADISRQLVQRLLSASSLLDLISLPALDVGGLRAGWASLTGSSMTVHGYSYIPGVEITGTLRARSDILRVGGAAAARGTLRRGPHGSLVGTLGGRHVMLPATAGATAAIVGGDASNGDRARAGAAVARLAERLERIWPAAAPVR
jgi:hypothetical protein